MPSLFKQFWWSNSYLVMKLLVKQNQGRCESQGVLNGTSLLSNIFQEINNLFKANEQLQLLIAISHGIGTGAVVQRRSVKTVLLRISLNSHENTCFGVFLNKVAGLRSFFDRISPVAACFIELEFLLLNLSVYFYSRVTAFKSSHWRCSVRKGVLRNFPKFTGRHLCQSLFFFFQLLSFQRTLFLLLLLLFCFQNHIHH